MPQRTYSEGEALKLALDFFEGDELRTSVFLNRYALRDREGRLLEATPEELWGRLVREASRVLGGAAREFLWLFTGFRFVPGGRILFGLGNWRKSTLFNCYFLPIREDSVRGITRFLDEAALADEPWALTFTTPREAIHRTLRAKEAWDTLVEAAWQSAEPGLLFWDRVRTWATAQYGGMEVQGVNVCGEVPMEPYGACNLGSLNLAAFVREPFTQRAHLDFAALEEATALAVRFLDAVVDLGKNRHPLKAQREASLRSRRIGLGIMGLADTLAMLGLPYGSEAGLRFAEKAMRRIKEAAYRESARLARAKGPFPPFQAEEHLKSPFIQALPEDLVRAVERGLRNAALLSIAPTGSISLLAGVTGGIEPIFALTYLRHAGGQVFLAEHPLLRRYRRERGGETPDWPTAHQVDPFQRVRLQAILQRHVDQSISSTVNLPRDTPKEVVERLFLTAWKEGCKGITVFREGSREEVIEPLPPVGVCTFCERA